MQVEYVELRVWIGSLILALCALAPAAFADDGWRLADPGDGNASFFLWGARGSVLYASNPDLWRSEDGGESWRWLPDRDFSVAGPLSRIRVDPSDPRRLVTPATGIPGVGSGLMLSEDGGNAWRHVAPPTTGVGWADFGHDGTLFTAADRLYRSRDLGETWTVAEALPGLDRTPGVIPTATGTGVWGEYEGVLYYSVDGGQTFRNLTESHGSLVAGPVYASPTDARRLAHGLLTNALVTSVDGGATIARTVVNGVVRALAVHPRRPERLAAIVDSGGAPRVYTTSDAGVTWSSVTVQQISAGPEIWFDACDDEVLYLRTEELVGVQRSDDWGRSWNLVGPQIPGRVSKMVPSTDCGTLAVSTAGPYRVSDRGDSWSSLPRGLAGAAPYGGFAFDPADAETVYAFGQGVHKSTDGGRSWSRLDNRIAGMDLTALEVGDALIWATGNGAFHRSSNGGEAFAPLHSGSGARDVKPDPFDPLRLLMFSSGLDGTRWTLSTDAGNSRGAEIRIGEGEDSALPGHLTFDPFRQGIVYGLVDRTGQFVVSTDGGQSFEVRGTLPVSWDVFDLVDIQVSPAGTLYAWNRPESGFWWSEDGGETWQSRFGALNFIRDFAVDAVQEGLLYAVSGTPQGRPFDPRMWRSVDNGESWQVWNQGLRRGSALVVAQNPRDPGVFLTTTNMGIARRDLDEPGPCADGDRTVLCLQSNRYEVDIRWEDADGRTGTAQWVPGSLADSGVMYFFDADNWEVLVKTLDGCSINDRGWVFTAATTEVGYTLTVHDRHAGKVRYYQNPLGRRAETVTDTAAFDGCE